jgi:hypothetical protein
MIQTIMEFDVLPVSLTDENLQSEIALLSTHFRQKDGLPLYTDVSLH